MGRKIPGKKRRGVKDPLKQQAERLSRLKSKVNAPPLDPDDQPIPKSLTRLFANTERQGRRRRERTDGRVESAAQPVRGLVRMVGEDARAFSQRISAATRLLIHPPSTYPVEEDEEDAKEARIAQVQERRRWRRARRPPPPAAQEPVQPPREPSPLRELVYERVPFGEVAHEPPTLRRVRRTPLAHSLLLARVPTALDTERRERARLDAVAAYRALKLSRRRAPIR